jgi:hypothetical protein
MDLLVKKTNKQPGFVGQEDQQITAYNRDE